MEFDFGVFCEFLPSIISKCTQEQSTMIMASEIAEIKCKTKCEQKLEDFDFCYHFGLTLLPLVTSVPSFWCP